MTKRSVLLDEASKQMKALKTIGHWRSIAVMISAIGIMLTYTGFASRQVNIIAAVPGIILLILSALSAMVMTIGIRSGRMNVEKILAAAEAAAN
ncbi:hypothetical protein SAMN06296386_10990 [Lachnospiraceae bacterium]|nr:hypothetical protein SAMN06296386_10990 [Lachnospiraceae bacterium]